MEKRIPLPLFRITQDFQIVERSDQAEHTFQYTNDLLDIVDADSHDKLKAMLAHDVEQLDFELNLITKHSPLALYKAFIQKSGEEAFCLFVPIEEQYQLVQNQLTDMQNRLNDTNFQLFEKKEKFSKMVDRSNELSGPYIELSDNLGLLPVFGDLSEEKLVAIKDNVFKRAYVSQPERVLIDFTGVGNIQEEGVRELKDLILVFEQMGIHVVMIGLSPRHALHLKPYRNELQIDFAHSAKIAIKKWLIAEYL
ncbi:hypothetical protein CR194_06875 [Salipaludibacillus keqinensis]|uniref:STAS domain-containing protein n=1 Tax=Salipaludibacillus keqinensis TaxID=2045207 RepID=A0A323TJR6_9BACI|nr:STAS domain-containing protein [Salipaludibacillus keqinensis]PYZ95231.1 hypothetical protein CR194_06875 [Salipaludibacillus keqinensis]